MITATRVSPCFCNQCGKQITTSEYAKKSRVGKVVKWLCFYDMRIKTLHNGATRWIMDNYGRS